MDNTTNYETSNPEYGALDSDVDPERGDGPYNRANNYAAELEAENERLKAAFDNLNHYATDEIERLRAALAKIADASDWHPDDMQAFAREALG